MSSPAALPALFARGLSQTYASGLARRKKLVLRGLDLGLERGERVALLGPNGSGKTTLLRILAGVERASAGELMVLGGDPRSRAVRRRVAYLPEDSPFPAELTAQGLLDLVGALGGLARAERRARGARLLERVGLSADAGRPLGRYSRGMLRRLGLAQAFLTSPELVLLDEPTAGLDARGFEAVDALLEEAQAAGTTLLLASHLPSDVQERCERFLVLVEGRLVAQGDVAALLDGATQARREVSGLDASGLLELERWVASQGGRSRPLLTTHDLIALYQRGIAEGVPR